MTGTVTHECPVTTIRKATTPPMIVSVPNMRERTIISMMTGPLRIRPMIQPTNMNAGPKKPSIPEHHMMTK